jgi:hypothetical protein
MTKLEEEVEDSDKASVLASLEDGEKWVPLILDFLVEIPLMLVLIVVVLPSVPARVFAGCVWSA